LILDDRPAILCAAGAAMYLRHTTVKKGGKTLTYWRLVRSVRHGRRVVQETVAHLGELDDAGRLRARALAREFMGDAEQLKLFEDVAPPPVAVAVHLDRIGLERGRSFGDVWLGCQLWRALQSFMNPRPLAVRPEKLRAVRRVVRRRLSSGRPRRARRAYMHDWRSLSHVRWECKYHVVIIPKFRQKVLFGKLRTQVGRILRELCDQREVELVEGNAAVDHVHMCLSIPPKYSVAHTVGFLKGKSAVRIHRDLLKERRMTGLHFWSTGYCVSTVGLDEERVRKYIREQEQLEVGQGDLDLK